MKQKTIFLLGFLALLVSQLASAQAQINIPFSLQPAPNTDSLKQTYFEYQLADITTIEDAVVLRNTTCKTHRLSCFYMEPKRKRPTTAVSPLLPNKSPHPVLSNG